MSLLLQNTRAVEQMASTISRELRSQIEEYNDTIKNSNDYISRKNELKDTDSNLIVLNYQMSQIQDLVSNLEDIQIKSELDDLINNIEGNIYRITEDILNEEFGIIEVSKWWEIDTYITSKLYTSNLDDFDTLSISILNDVKKKYEIYC